MVRRLASRSRDDRVASQRDYQTIVEMVSLRIGPRGAGSQRLVLRTTPTATTSNLAAFGGFLKPDRPLAVEIALQVGAIRSERTVALSTGWNRIGIVIEAAPGEICAVVTWQGDSGMHMWGLDAGFLSLPEVVRTARPTLDDLGRTHLAPETFYLPHEGPIALEIDSGASAIGETGPGAPVYLKKCAYCARYLPIDPHDRGMLSFHRHAAKLTGHQNECRSCKKWRINDSLNEVRTIDQLNESSLITRERKAFLREPEILQAIKDRSGAGLKSQVWDRFDRKCFYCGVPLELDEVQLDHTRPLAYLWPIDEYATCLCADHNGEKRERFPIDFYSSSQLRELARITGMPLADLSERRLNERELARVLADLPTFAKQWEPRHFSATARKIAELRPDINLFELLEEQDADTHAILLKRLQERPAPASPIYE